LQEKRELQERANVLIGGVNAAHDTTGRGHIFVYNPLIAVAYEPGKVEREVLCGAVRALVVQQGCWQPVVEVLVDDLHR
jgi:hypothetical protein